MDIKRLLIASTALLALAPDVALAYQAGPQRPSTKPARPSTKPSRPSTKPAPSRPATKPARPDNQRPSRPTTKPSRPSNQRPNNRPSTYRPGHRPSSYHRIHASVYVYPRGYRYRRWTTGLLLPALFLSNQYYYTNYYALGLGPPPSGYVWVRYGPDLLLVQRGTGRIVDVIYGAFY